MGELLDVVREFQVVLHPVLHGGRVDAEGALVEDGRLPRVLLEAHDDPGPGWGGNSMALTKGAEYPCPYFYIGGMLVCNAVCTIRCPYFPYVRGYSTVES